MRNPNAQFVLAADPKRQEVTLAAGEVLLLPSDATSVFVTVTDSGARVSYWSTFAPYDEASK
jgi:predicted 2-oxoglutarate/Fe(II)-dependent dioxygenase YbiX